MKEIWKESKYPYLGILVSNMGGLKKYKNGSWIMKSVSVDKDGYLKTYAYDSEKKIETTVRVHRLIANTFLSNNKNLEVVNHKNHIKYDNRVDNLEWCTVQENTIDYYNNYYGTNGEFLKMKSIDGSIIYFSSFNELAKSLKINRNTVPKLLKDDHNILDFIEVSKVDSLEAPLNKEYLTGVINLNKFNPFKISNGDKDVYYFNGKTASLDLTSISSSMIRHYIRNESDTKFGKFTKVSQYEYLKNNNQIKLNY